VLEASDYLGGISRTHRWNGNRLDIGGHRFFTKSQVVQKLWSEMMDEPMLKVPRLSRIFYHGKFFQYPLQVGNTLSNLGLYESFMMVGSYVRMRLNPEKPEDSFQSWVCATVSATAFTARFSKPTPRKSGAFHAPKSAPIGPRSASMVSAS